MADDAILRLCDLQWRPEKFWERACIPLMDGSVIELERVLAEGAALLSAGPVEVGSCVASVVNRDSRVLLFPHHWEHAADELTLQCWLIEYLRDHPRR